MTQEYQTNKIRVVREITPEWQRLMDLAERVKKGRIEIIFNEGRPVQAEIIVQKVKLDCDEDIEKMKVFGL